MCSSLNPALGCRHRAALVSRRWHAAAHSPAVLLKHGVSLLSHRNGASTQLQSLAAWLARHGQHVRRIRLSCSPKRQFAEPCAWELASCLSACAAVAAGSLQQLMVDFNATGVPLCVTSWCAPLRQLSSLWLSGSVYTDLRISSSLAGLTAVTDLSLKGSAVSIDAAAQLPPNVEQLKLCDYKSTALPRQVRVAGWGLGPARLRSCAPAQQGCALLCNVVVCSRRPRLCSPRLQLPPPHLYCSCRASAASPSW